MIEEEEKESGKRWEVLQKGFLGEDKCRSPKGKQKEERERKTKCSQGKDRRKNKAGIIHLNTIQRTGFPLHEIRYF